MRLEDHTGRFFSEVCPGPKMSAPERMYDDSTHHDVLSDIGKLVVALVKHSRPNEGTDVFLYLVNGHYHITRVDKLTFWVGESWLFAE